MSRIDYTKATDEELVRLRQIHSYGIRRAAALIERTEQLLAEYQGRHQRESDGFDATVAELRRRGLVEWTHVVTGGPWPERHGKRCRIVPPPDVEPGEELVWPWRTRSGHEELIVVLIEDDDLDPVPGQNGEWTCRIDRGDIGPLPAEEES